MHTKIDAIEKKLLLAKIDSKIKNKLVQKVQIKIQPVLLLSLKKFRGIYINNIKTNNKIQTTV